jgi:hypothetical protein
MLMQGVLSQAVGVLSSWVPCMMASTTNQDVQMAIAREKQIKRLDS